MIVFGHVFSFFLQVIFWAAAFFTSARILHMAGWGFVPDLTNVRPPRKGSMRKKLMFRIRRGISYLVKDDLSESQKLALWAKEETLAERPSPTPGKTPYVKILLFAFGIRFVTLLLGYGILALEGGQPPTLLELFEAFRRGDSYHYLNLAATGYSWTEDGKNLLLVFFPLYGYLVRGMNLLVGHYLASAYIVTFLCFAFGLCYLYRLVRLEFSASVAWWALVLISIAPHGFFFGVPMTESLFLLTTAMTLYYIRIHKWYLAGIGGAFAAFTRMVGVILIIVAIVEFLTHYRVIDLIKRAKWGEIFRLMGKKGVWLLVMLLGSGAYLYINWYISGDPFRFLHYQRTHWHNEFTYFGEVIQSQFANIVHHDPILTRTIFVPNILAFTLTVGMLLYATIKRLSVTHIAYLLGYTFLSFAVSWLLSGGRYMAAAVPLFIFLAHFTERRLIFRLLVPAALLAGLIATMRWYILGEPVF